MFSIFLAILIHAAAASGFGHPVHAPAMHVMDTTGGPMP